MDRRSFRSERYRPAARIKAASQSLSPDKDCEAQFSLGENHDKVIGFPGFSVARHLPEVNDVRPSLRKATCSAMATASSAGNQGSVVLSTPIAKPLGAAAPRAKEEADWRPQLPSSRADGG